MVTMVIVIIIENIDVMDALVIDLTLDLEVMIRNFSRIWCKRRTKR